MISVVNQYFRESWAELQKVIWPRREETVRHTLVVIAISAFVALLFFLLDRLFVSVLIGVLGA